MAARLTHVVDACALIAYLKEEPGHQQLADIVAQEENVLGIHSLTACEVYCCYYRVDGVAQANVAYDKLTQLLQVCTLMDHDFFKRVARWKVEQVLPMLDAVAAATAENFACPIITTDRNHFDPVAEAAQLEVIFLR